MPQHCSLDNPSKADRLDRMHGLLLGGALGDSVGLPAEGMSRRRIARRWSGAWQQRLVWGRGMVSDDTEHAVMTALALGRHPSNVSRFVGDLAVQFRWWLAALPAGVGLATGRAICKLWLGMEPGKSGVHSAGNGAAMRSTVIGAVKANDLKQLEDFTIAAATVTHTDPRAISGALAVSRLAAWIANHPRNTRPDLSELEGILLDDSTETSWEDVVSQLLEATGKNLSVEDYAVSIGLEAGVSGYVYHTVPVAIYAWQRHPGDFVAALEAVFNCGGDTDTVGAIAGSLMGLSGGASALPRRWVERLVDWPCSRNRLQRVSEFLVQGEGDPGFPVVIWPVRVLRNLFFLVVVLLHGFRRLLPPY